MEMKTLLVSLLFQIVNTASAGSWDRRNSWNPQTSGQPQPKIKAPPMLIVAQNIPGYRESQYTDPYYDTLDYGYQPRSNIPPSQPEKSRNTLANRGNINVAARAVPIPKQLHRNRYNNYQQRYQPQLSLSDNDPRCQSQTLQGSGTAPRNQYNNYQQQYQPQLSISDNDPRWLNRGYFNHLAHTTIRPPTTSTSSTTPSTTSTSTTPPSTSVLTLDLKSLDPTTIKKLSEAGLLKLKSQQSGVAADFFGEPGGAEWLNIFRELAPLLPAVLTGASMFGPSAGGAGAIPPPDSIVVPSDADILAQLGGAGPDLGAFASHLNLQEAAAVGAIIANNEPSVNPIVGNNQATFISGMGPPINGQPAPINGLPGSIQPNRQAPMQQPLSPQQSGAQNGHTSPADVHTGCSQVDCNMDQGTLCDYMSPQGTTSWRVASRHAPNALTGILSDASGSGMFAYSGGHPGTGSGTRFVISSKEFKHTKGAVLRFRYYQAGILGRLRVCLDNFQAQHCPFETTGSDVRPQNSRQWRAVTLPLPRDGKEHSVHFVADGLKENYMIGLDDIHLAMVDQPGPVDCV